MNGKSVVCLLIVSVLFSGFAQAPAGVDPLREFQARAAKFKSLIRLPLFEVSTNEVRASLQHTITSGNAALDAKNVTFESTAGALDDLAYQIGLTANKLSVIKETSQDASMRDAATEAVKELEEWSVGLDYRE